LKKAAESKAKIELGSWIQPPFILSTIFPFPPSSCSILPHLIDSHKNVESGKRPAWATAFSLLRRRSDPQQQPEEHYQVTQKEGSEKTRKERGKLGGGRGKKGQHTKSGSPHVYDYFAFWVGSKQLGTLFEGAF
jgi:hypothetical protein